MDVSAADSTSNTAAATRFCRDETGGSTSFDAAQAWGTHENDGVTSCMKLNGDAWEQDDATYKTIIVNVECVEYPTDNAWKATCSSSDSLEDDAPDMHGWWGSAWR